MAGGVGYLSFTTLGPLTTTFVPPSSCTQGFVSLNPPTSIYDISTSPTFSIIYIPYGHTLACRSDYDDRYVSEVTADACWPSTATSGNDPNYSFRTSVRTVYSPGAICPSDLTLDATFTSFSSDSRVGHRAIAERETWGVCCPSQYTCVSTSGINCLRTAFAGEFLSGWAAPDSRDPAAACEAVYTTAPSLTHASYFMATPLILARKDNDPPFAEKPNHEPPKPPKDNTRNKKLAYNVGLGVGIPVGIIAITILVLCIQRFRRKQKRESKEAAQQ